MTPWSRSSCCAQRRRSPAFSGLGIFESPELSLEPVARISLRSIRATGAEPNFREVRQLSPLYLHDLISLGAAGRNDLDIGAFPLADQGAGQRRGDRDLACLRVGLGFDYDLPDRLLVSVLVDQRDGRAEFDRVARQLRNIDDFGARKLILQLRDAALIERLLFFRGMVFGVLRQIAVRTCVGNLLNDTRTLNLLAMLEFVFQNGIARRRHRYLVHRFSIP